MNIYKWDKLHTQPLPPLVHINRSVIKHALTINDAVDRLKPQIVRDFSVNKRL